MARPDLSVCIVNWNTRQDLEQAITSVLQSDPELEPQVIVLDNASSDGTPEMVREQFPSVKLLESAENLGFAKGYNRAAEEAEGRHILMLNPDTVVQAGALRSLVRFLDSRQEAGAAGPRLLNSDGTVQYSCRRLPGPMAAILRNTLLGRLVPGNRFTRDYLMADWDHRTVRQVDWVSGAAICIRRETWSEVGGFDEGYFMYAEDIDWCLRAHHAGWHIYYVPASVVVHRIGRSSDQRPVRMVVEFHRSMARFYKRHYADQWPFGLRWLPLAGIWARGAVVLLQTMAAQARDRLTSTESKSQ
jgi:GT2 family glycosyltransferase